MYHGGGYRWLFVLEIIDFMNINSCGGIKLEYEVRSSLLLVKGRILWNCLGVGGDSHVYVFV